MNLLARHVILRALLRWTAAVAFCIPLKHRPHARLRALGMLLPLLGLTYVLDPSAQSTSLHGLQFSLLTLYVAFFVLLGMMIYACVEIDKKSALYCAVWSLLASQTAYECRKLSSDGWNVLLSPACASFDMFSDYESRGRIFKELVRELK